MPKPVIPRIEQLRVKNYRALRDLELKNITPLTVFLGPNGSGKSTIFDIFAFLSECFQLGLRRAWDRRGRFRELRTRGAEGPISFELKYREKPKAPIITYYLAIDEGNRGPYVAQESLQWRRGQKGAPFQFLGGLNKVEAARTISEYMQPQTNQSPSFQCFNSGIQAFFK
ncbi:MAG: AAA family ATPase [Coleofasciculus sp. C2-GNP5-27]